MKKIGIIIICMLLLTNMHTVFANELDIVANIVYDYNDDTVSINGSIDTNRGNIFLVATLFYNNSAIDSVDTIYSINNNVGIFLFPKMQMKLNYPTGVYTIKINSNFTNELLLTFNYINISETLIPLNIINIATMSDMENRLKTNASLLGLPIEKYNKLSSNAKLLLNNLVVIKDFDIPADTSTDSKIKQLYSAVKELREVFNKGLAVGEFSDLKNINELEQWFLRYKDTYSINSDLFKEYMKMSDKEVISTRIIKDKSIGTIEEIKDRIDEIIFTHLITISHFSRTTTLLDTYKNKLFIDYSVFEKLKNKQEVCISLGNKQYDYYRDVKKTFEDMADALYTIENKNGGNGGNSGNQGSGSRPSGQINIVNTQTENLIVENFTDLGDYLWAKESIDKLYKKGIINGRANNIFAPGEYITRAEFIKIVILAFSIENNNEKSNAFGDVFENDWYYSYVVTAFNNSIIAGDNNGNFNPNSLVTRQDMVTILYRVIKPTNYSDYSVDFSDKDDIASYAVPAVSYMNKKGILNGVGENLFAPLLNANRAGAAKLIAQLIN